MVFFIILLSYELLYTIKNFYERLMTEKNKKKLSTKILNCISQKKYFCELSQILIFTMNTDYN